MKTINKISIFAVVSVIAATSLSCTKEDIKIKEASVIKASIEQVADPDATKTSLGAIEDTKYPILWSTGDALAASSQTGSEKAQYTLTSTAGSRQGEFQLTSGSEPSGAIYTYYPYSNVISVSGSTYTVTIPATQAYAENSFGTGAMPMYAEATSIKGSIVFKPLLSTLKLQLKGTCQVKRIIVSSDTEDLSGTATIDMTTGAITFTEGKKQVELTCNNVQLNESTATLFHICLPATVSANKYKVYVVTNTNTVMVKSTGSTSFKTGVIKKMAELTFAPIIYSESGSAALICGNTIWAPENCGYTSSTSVTNGAKGRIYQWGRSVGSYWGSSTQTSSSIPSTVDTPADNIFYVNNVSPYDWRVTQLSSWPMSSDDSGYIEGKVDNPCPTGWRVPTVDEYGYLCYTDYNPSTKTGTTRREGSIVTTPLAGWQFNLNGSYLRFVHSGSRAGAIDGIWSQNNIAGTYFSSTANTDGHAYAMVIATSNERRAWIDNLANRANGFSVRCVSTSSIQ